MRYFLFIFITIPLISGGHMSN
ncbi:sel1 repeat family protein, partial [Shigella boydii]|nr:sel1 repeat family protein [Shigella boydii]